MEKNKISLGGNGVAVEIEGESNVFGGNDLKLKAILALITSLDFKFEEDIDNIKEIYYITILDRIGDLIKMDSIGDHPEKNVQTVLDYITSFFAQRLDQIPEFQEIMDQRISGTLIRSV